MNITFHDYLLKIKRYLFPLLFINVIINIVVLIVVVVFMPDIAQLKAASGYKELYDQIPYFGTLFRMASVTQSFGYLAIPITFYYLSVNKKKDAIKAFILSSSTLISGIAFYSRATILSYFLTIVFYYLIIRKTIPEVWDRRISSIVRKMSIVIIGGFLTITIIRFSAMDYYEERIPSNSIIKDPVIYSLFDYASMGYPSGVDCLEKYKSENCLNGEYYFTSLFQILSYFGLMNWNAESFEERAERAFSDNYTAFNGLVATNVCIMGYFATFLYTILVFIYLKKKLVCRCVSILSLNYVLFLLNIAINSVFYSNIASFLYPFLFLCFVTFFPRLGVNKKICKI